MRIKISVVIPTYRRPGLLKKCLEALAAQKVPSDQFEVLVVSDGPDPETEATVKAFSQSDRFIRFLHTKVKQGPAAARNYGWRKAAGVLIAFTDDDTVPAPQWLSAFWQIYKGEEKIAYTGRIKVPVSTRPTDYEKNTAGLETAEFVTANCCCTRAALQAVGGFDERFSMAWREDSDLEFKLLQHGIPIIHVSEALLIHPVRKAPWGISIKEQKKGMFNALLYKKYPRLYRQKIQPAPAWHYYLMDLALMLLIAGFPGKAKGLTALALVCWLFLLIRFIYKRLATTSKSPSHVAEMIVTSMVIPVTSVYWQLYGAWKYRVLFL